MRLGTLSVVFFLVVFSVVLSTSVHAQTVGTVLVNPQFPQPGESFTASIPSVDPFAKIVWYRDGTVIPDIENMKTITLTAKGIGVTEKIRADITTSQGESIQAYRTITPVRTDIIITADTLVPSFYKGRKLGTSGSTMRATVLPFLGSPKESGALTYLWSVGGTVQNGGVASTQRTISFSSNFENELIVGVKIFKNNTQIGEKSIVVPIVKPEMYFYEKNPLRGLSKVTLKDPVLFIGEELLLRAEAYFIDRDLTHSGVIRTWRIDKQKVTGNSSDPYELTLEKKGSGTAEVSFSLQNMAKLLQGITGSIGVQF